MATRRTVLQLAAGAAMLPGGVTIARRREMTPAIEVTGGPMPVGGWANSSLAYTGNQHAVSGTGDQVFCGAVGDSSFLLMIGPDEIMPLHVSDARLPRGNAQGILLGGWFYLIGRRPQLRTRLAAGWSTSTCIAALALASVHRFFLFDPAMGQNVTVQLLDANEQPKNEQRPYVVDNLKEAGNGDVYLDVVQGADGGQFQGDWQLVATNQSVQDQVTAIKARAVTAGVRI